MKAKEMHSLAHKGNHTVCAKGYDSVPNVTGDPDLDATIMHRHNVDMPKRLELYVKHRSYGSVTGYSGYRNYSGDT